MVHLIRSEQRQSANYNLNAGSHRLVDTDTGGDSDTSVGVAHSLSVSGAKRGAAESAVGKQVSDSKRTRNQSYIQAAAT